MKLLVAAWAGMGNIGDDWLISTAIQELNGHHTVGMLLEPFADGAALPAVPVVRWPALNRSGTTPIAISHFRKAISPWDAILFAGGGWLAGDQGIKSVARWYLRCLLSNKPYALAGVGIGPFRNRYDSELGAAVLKRARSITVRTKSDAVIVRRLTGRDPLVTGDLTMADRVISEGSREGVVISAPAPSKHWLPEESVAQYVEAMTTCAGRLAHGEGIVAVSFQSPNDGDFWRRYLPVVSPSSPEVALSFLAKAKVVIAARLHASIGACCTKTPQVAVGYHHKSAVLSEQFGVPVIRVQDFLRHHDLAVPSLPTHLVTGRPAQTLLDMAASLR